MLAGTAGHASLVKILRPTLLVVAQCNRAGKTAYDTARGKLSAGEFIDLSGVDDGGFLVGGGNEATLMFYKGTTLVPIILVRADGPPTQAAITLAKTVAANT